VHFSVCLPIQQSVHFLYMRLLVCPSFCLSVFLSVHLYVCLSIQLSVCLPVSQSVCLSLCLSFHLSIFLYVHQPICLYIHQFICLYVHQSACLSLCLPLSVCFMVLCPSSHISTLAFLIFSSLSVLFLGITLSVHPLSVC